MTRTPWNELRGDAFEPEILAKEILLHFYILLPSISSRWSYVELSLQSDLINLIFSSIDISNNDNSKTNI